MIWEPFVLALFLGLIVSAGLYFAYLWPSVEPVEPGEPVEVAASPTEPAAATANSAEPAPEDPEDGTAGDEAVDDPAPADDEASARS